MTRLHNCQIMARLEVLLWRQFLSYRSRLWFSSFIFKFSPKNILSKLRMLFSANIKGKRVIMQQLMSAMGPSSQPREVGDIFRS